MASFDPVPDRNLKSSREDEFTFASEGDRDSAAMLLAGSRKSSYSLLLLFYLTTMSAILVAACRLAFVENTWTFKAFLIGYLVIGFSTVVMCMIIGFLVGRTWVSTLLGLLAGLLCGLIAVMMVLVQPVHYDSLGLVLVAGCWLMAVITMIGNRWQA